MLADEEAAMVAETPKEEVLTIALAFKWKRNVM